MVALDQAKIKQDVVNYWMVGGGNTLVKVVQRGLMPAADRDVGFCTLIKFLLGRTPAEMEAAVGLRSGSKLLNGADIYRVDPLPSPQQFNLRGYSQTPGGISTSEQAATVDYPPGLGVPQWELVNYPQSELKFLAGVLPGEVFLRAPGMPF